MPENGYMLVIVLLLPLTAGALVSQVNPYHALVIRGILGAVAALIYALFGAADVALTEALVGTMLSITLYAVAVRSSLTMRLGVLEHSADAVSETLARPHLSDALLSALRTLLAKHHMRLELIPYTNDQALQAALHAKDIHTTCVLLASATTGETLHGTDAYPAYSLETRVPRLYELMASHLPSDLAVLTNSPEASSGQAASESSSLNKPNAVEVQS